jgi:hypothetical protein
MSELENQLDARSNVSSFDKLTYPFLDQLRITLTDIDESMFYYIRDVIKPFYNVGETRRYIPVIWANPERWKQIKRDASYRDPNGDILSLPIITMKNSGFSKDMTMNSIYSQKVPIKVKKKAIDGQNWEENEWIMVDFPNFITVTYDVTIWSNYQQHMNEIINRFALLTDWNYWENPKNPLIRILPFFNSEQFNRQHEYGEGDRRVIKVDFSIECRTYIMESHLGSDMTIKKSKKMKISTSERVL